MFASEPWACPWLFKHIPENQVHGQRKLLDPERTAKSQKGCLPAVPKLSSPPIHPPTPGGRRKSLRTERHPGPTSKGHKRVLRCFRETAWAQTAAARPWGSCAESDTAQAGSLKGRTHLGLRQGLGLCLEDTSAGGRHTRNWKSSRTGLN